MNAQLRLAVFQRDSFTCVYCGRRPPEVSLEPDHVLPRALGGQDLATNLVTACKPCNGAKSDRTIGLPPGYTPEPVGFQRRQRGPILNVGGALSDLRWCRDACPTCATEALPLFVIDGDARSVQLAYRCTQGHPWHTWWTPGTARVHAAAVRRAAA